jgi:peptide/nickel transport system permease protein
MRLVNYVLTRLLYAIPVLLGVTLLVFLISHAIPGDPARMMAGQKASREAVENIRRSFGLDRPLPEQFVVYLFGVAKGDLGTSIRTSAGLDDCAFFGHSPRW